MGQALRRMRCSGACRGRVAAAWLVTGPILNAQATKSAAAGARGAGIAAQPSVERSVGELRPDGAGDHPAP